MSIGFGPFPHGNGERQIQQVHLQADLIGHPHQCGMRERPEVQVGHQRTRIVHQPVVRRIDVV
ncbi:Uncharacterised protein [Mycobacterium tuberculosis]|nr:Uncharacterised protein [Mycobacterium tuberculosis]